MAGGNIKRAVAKTKQVQDEPQMKSQKLGGQALVADLRDRDNERVIVEVNCF